MSSGSSGLPRTTRVGPESELWAHSSDQGPCLRASHPLCTLGSVPLEVRLWLCFLGFCVEASRFPAAFLLRVKSLNLLNVGREKPQGRGLDSEHWENLFTGIPQKKTPRSPSPDPDHLSSHVHCDWSLEGRHRVRCGLGVTRDGVMLRCGCSACSFPTSVCASGLCTCAFGQVSKCLLCMWLALRLCPRMCMEAAGGEREMLAIVNLGKGVQPAIFI